MQAKKILIVIPTLNEQNRIKKCLLKIEDYLKKNNLFDFCEILVADGGSRDKTEKIVKDYQKIFKNIFFENFKRGGRGYQLKKAFFSKKADIYFYMDVDLATDLSFFSKGINFLEKGYDIVFGSRYKRGAQRKRTFLREIFGKSYSLLIRVLFRSPFFDYQCGFKGFKKNVLPLIKEIEDDYWFWDTEFIIKAWKKGFKIKEMPVFWEEKEGTRVKILKDAFEMAKKAFFLRLKI